MNKFIIILVVLILFPNIGSGYQPAVVSANPVASKIGLEILNKGGSAADAAIATAFALGVVEPHNSGLGGGGFLLYYDAREEKFSFVDYREVSPQNIQSAFFKKKPEFMESGIYSVAVPGFLLGMETIHKKWRRISWPAILDPAIKLAKKGISFSGRMKDEIKNTQDRHQEAYGTVGVSIISSEGKFLKSQQEDMAKTLQDIQTGGSAVFYRGGLAKKIAVFMKEAKGLMTIDDLKNYHVYFREPFEFEFENNRIISAPLPSSGGRGLNYLFKRAIIYHLETFSPLNPRTYEILLDALKNYMDYRAVALGDTSDNIVGHTTHLSVIDQEGNMAAMTNTLNYPFGSGVVVPGTGIILNNEMADFSLDANTANRLRPASRPLSSMSPTFIFKDDKPHLIIGTPGGTTIPQNLFQILFYDIKWGSSLKRAIAQPKIYYSKIENEVVVEGAIKKSIVEELKKTNSVRVKPTQGNVQALLIKSIKRTESYSDPRGEGGAALGKP